MKAYIGLLGFLFFVLGLSAQDWEGLKYENHIYKEHIKTVKLYAKRGTGTNKPVQYFEYEQELHEPYIKLNSFERLYLYFDDMDYDAKDYTYTIIHCDANWKPSNLTEMDYIKNFAENDNFEYDYSVHEDPGYTNYSVQFPNDDLGILLSGNYVLVVYEDGDKEQLVLSRRFIVYEDKYPIEHKFRRPFDTYKMDTHQEIEFSIFHKGTVFRNPLKEIKASVLQNGRWDNAKLNISPKYIRQNSLDFDYVDKIVFEAGNEYRLLDLRSLELLGAKMQVSTENTGQKEVFLADDLDRSEQIHLSRADLNGKYAIVNNDNFDFSILNNTPDGVESSLNDRKQKVLDGTQDQENTDATYSRVHFSLRSPFALEKKKIYLFGELTDWKIKPEYELSYNEEKELYEGAALLKQGLYDYAYVAVSEGESTVDYSVFEGNSFETINRYTIIVYYRPFGQQYDRVVAIREFRSDVGF